MGLRITQAMLVRTALADVTRARERLAITQEQASSGLRINRPSDDPAGASAALLLRSGLDAIDQFMRNVSQARARVAVSESHVAEAVDVMIRARELAVTGANGIHDADSRRQIAREIETLHASLAATANSRFGGGFLFAGYAADAAPFAVAGSFGDAPPSSPTVGFVGDSNEIQIAIDHGVQVRAGFDGRRVFLGDADGDGSADPGHQDLFQVLADLRDALMNDDPVAVAGTLDRIDESLVQLGDERTAMGAVAGQLEQWDRQLAQRSEDLSRRLSETQDADAARVFSDLIQQETALQAGLQAMSQMIQPTLMDFLG